MMKRVPLFIFGAAVFASAALVLSAAALPAPAQSSSSSSKSATSSASKKKKTSSKYRKKSRTRAQAAPTPDRIKEIQSALQKDGSYQGEPTGKWDAATIDAMRKFQDKSGFPATGKIDAPSLNKLGLGSETAGKGAPIPVATASAPPAPTSASSTPHDAPDAASPAEPPNK